MKNYLKFNLAGKKLFPLWFAFLIFFVVPYMLFIVKYEQTIITGERAPWWIFLLLIPIIVAVFVFTFYYIKFIIEGIEYKEKSLLFSGKFWEYFGIILLGFFLSVITFGIYGAWYCRDIQRFFLKNTTHDSHNFNFLGKGGKLLVILLLTMYIPIVILAILNIKYFNASTSVISWSKFAYQIVVCFIMIPYMYLVYKWLVNISHKDYRISWETKFCPSCGKIALEMLLTVITVGIYFPLAIVRLYKYFAEKTIITGQDTVKRFGYDKDQLGDFLLIWGQTLLTIITLGIYFPWACCKIMKNILGRTYIEENSLEVN